MPNPQIPINSNDGGDDGNDLIDCYFQEVDSTNTFNLYQSDGTQITTYVDTAAQPVANGDEFTFSYNGLNWSVTDFLISETDLTASGEWSASPGTIGDDPETGTFQAQGGGSNPELSARASA